MIADAINYLIGFGAVALAGLVLVLVILAAAILVTACLYRIVRAVRGARARRNEGWGTWNTEN